LSTPPSVNGRRRRFASCRTALTVAQSPIEEIFPELVDGLADILRQFLSGNRTPEVAAKEFLIGTTLLKGIDYKPEREVRVVAIPGTAQAARYAAREFPVEFDATLPLPEIRTRPGT
jgi:hypothetical protein